MKLNMLMLRLRGFLGAMYSKRRATQRTGVCRKASEAEELPEAGRSCTQLPVTQLGGPFAPPYPTPTPLHPIQTASMTRW